MNVKKRKISEKSTKLLKKSAESDERILPPLGVLLIRQSDLPLRLLRDKELFQESIFSYAMEPFISPKSRFRFLSLFL